MIKITVKAAGVNRADYFYKQGKYPYFGLECAGIDEQGRRVAAIVAGGAFEKTVEADECAVLEIPDNMSFVEAAAITEGLWTAYYNLVDLCKLQAGERVLIHGGAGSVGVVAIQLAKLPGAEVFATSSKTEKLELIKNLGATAIDYTQGFGENKYDVILDIIGAEYFNKNLAALKKNGRLAIIGFIGGAKTEANLAPILLKNLSIFGSTITGLSNNRKAEIKKEIQTYFGKIKPAIHKTYDINNLNEAIDAVGNYKNAGKVIITF